MYGYIYLTTDLKTNKKYIGKHKSSVFEGLKYIGSGKIIQSIKKYCKNNNIPLEDRFSVSLLSTADTADELNEKEIKFISEYDCCNSNDFYNLAKGGEGGDLSEYIDYTKTTKFGSENWNYGKEYKWFNDGIKEYKIFDNDIIPCGLSEGRLPMTEEQKKKLSENHNTYRENFSDDYIRYLSDRWVGEGNPNVKNPKFGKENQFYGKHHSDESKKLNSEKHKIKYICPFCKNYISNHGCVTKHIYKNHEEELMQSSTTIESITYEKYIGE